MHRHEKIPRQEQGRCVVPELEPELGLELVPEWELELRPELGQRC